MSTDEQAKGDSPEHHRVRAQSYAEAMGWTVSTVYDLAGVSGKTVMDHPECRRMMDDVRAKRITGLVFSNLMRLCRNKRELEDFAAFFRDQDADLVSIQDAIDTSTPAGRMFFTFRAAQAHWEREEISSRVAVSVPIRAKLGKPLGGIAPYGYRWEGKNLVIEPTDAAVRKLIYELFAEHKRIKTVAQILNDRGYRTRDRANVKGGLFSGTAVQRIIEDTSAKGEYRRNHTRSLGAKQGWKVKPEHEWIINAIEPIVSVELWDKCNALLEARQTKRARPAKRGRGVFSDYVFCSCGKKMYFPQNTPKWVCRPCKNKIPVADLEAAFLDEIRGFMVSAEKVTGYLASAQTGLAERRAALETLRKEKDKVKREADKCFELYEAGALTVPQFKERFQPLDARRHQIEREIPRIEAEISAQSTDGVSLEHVAAEARNFCDNWPKLPEDRKRQIVDVFLKRIVVSSDEVKIEVFNLPAFANS
ncbi:MAG: recombinase family protein [Verrucomicrobia bacterium]|nr:recombinase family protein [Verrucomicrobiota bacterium]